MKKTIINELDLRSYKFLTTAIDSTYEKAINESDEEEKEKKFKYLYPYLLRLMVLEVFGYLIYAGLFVLAGYLSFELINKGKSFIYIFGFLLIPILFNKARMTNTFHLFRIAIIFCFLGFFVNDKICRIVFEVFSVLVFIYTILFNYLVSKVSKNRKLFLNAIEAFKNEALKEIETREDNIKKLESKIAENNMKTSENKKEIEENKKEDDDCV